MVDFLLLNFVYYAKTIEYFTLIGNIIKLVNPLLKKGNHLMTTHFLLHCL